MPSYQTFVSSRTSTPDMASLAAALRALDATAAVSCTPGTITTYVVKKSTAWTAPQITAAQNAIDTAPASTPELTAQAAIDNADIVTKAIVLALIDQLNTIRAALPVPLGPISPAQALAAIRAKAGTL